MQRYLLGTKSLQNVSCLWKHNKIPTIDFKLILILGFIVIKSTSMAYDNGIVKRPKVEFFSINWMFWSNAHNI